MKIATLIAALAASPAAAAACGPVAQTGEIGELRVGEVVYLDLAATLRLRIKSVDEADGVICGSTDKGDECRDAEEVYSGAGVAACSAARGEALGVGVIFLYGEPEEEEEASREEKAQ